MLLFSKEGSDSTAIFIASNKRRLFCSVLGSGLGSNAIEAKGQEGFSNGPRRMTLRFAASLIRSKVSKNNYKDGRRSVSAQLRTKQNAPFHITTELSFEAGTRSLHVLLRPVISFAVLLRSRPACCSRLRRQQHRAEDLIDSPQERGTAERAGIASTCGSVNARFFHAARSG